MEFNVAAGIFHPFATIRYPSKKIKSTIGQTMVFTLKKLNRRKPNICARECKHFMNKKQNEFSTFVFFIGLKTAALVR